MFDCKKEIPGGRGGGGGGGGGGGTRQISFRWGLWIFSEITQFKHLIFQQCEN